MVTHSESALHTLGSPQCHQHATYKVLLLTLIYLAQVWGAQRLGQAVLLVNVAERTDMGADTLYVATRNLHVHNNIFNKTNVDR